MSVAFRLFFLNEVIELNRAPLPLVWGGGPLVVAVGAGGGPLGGAGTLGVLDVPWLSTD